MRRLAPLLLSLVSVTALAQALPPVQVGNAWARASTPGATTGAIYVTVTASEPERLTGASTPAAQMAQVHQTKEVGSVMEMREVSGGLPVTPGAPIQMAPGGYHIMLMGLKQPLKQGDTVPVTLTFEHAAPVTVQATIAGPGASAPPAK